MKKTLSIVLSLVLALGMIPSFAADDAMLQENDKTKYLVEQTILEGNEHGDLMLSKELTRAEAAKLVIYMNEGKASAEELKKAADISKVEMLFADVKKDEWFAPWVAITNEKGLMIGTGDDKFAPNKVITKQEFSLMMLRALGYTGDKEVKWEDAAKKAAELGLIADAENADKVILRGNSFDMMYETLMSKNVEGKVLYKELGYSEPAQEQVKEFAVKSVESNGLKVIDVEFTKAINKDTKNKIKVKDADKNDVVVDKRVVLEEGKKIAVVLKDTATQGAKYKVIIEKVKSEDKSEMVEKEEMEVTFLDTTKPMVEEVKVVNPKVLKIMASEPINLVKPAYATLSQVKVDGKKAYAKVINYYNGVLKLEFHKALKAGEHDVVVENLKDFAGLPIDKFETTITVEEDKEAPQVVDAAMVATDEVKVVFNEDVHKLGKFKIDGKLVSASAYYDADNKKEIKLTPASELKMGAIVEVKVEYKDQKDIIGNKVKDWTTYTFKVEDDTTLPEAEIKGINEDNSKIVEIQFTKAMKKGQGKWKLLDKDNKKKANGTIPSVASAWEDEGKLLKLEIAYLDDKNEADYKLVLEEMKDGTVRHNEMAKATLDFTGKDTKKPEVVVVASGKHFQISTDNKERTIIFSEAMKEDALKNAQNYTFFSSGDAYKGTFADIASDKREIKVVNSKTVKLIVKDATVAIGSMNVAADDKIALSANIKDVAGNSVKEAGVKLEGTSAPTAPLIKQQSGQDKATVKVSDDEQYFEVPFDQPVKINDGKVKLGSTVLATIESTEEYSDTQKFLIPSELKYSADISENRGDITFEAGAFENAVGTKNVSATITNVNLIDGIKPSIVEDGVKVKNAHVITVEYTEALDTDYDTAVKSITVSKDGQSVGTEDGSNGSTLSNSDKTVEIYLTNAMELDGTYKVQIEVQDAHQVNSELETKEVTVDSGDDITAPQATEFKVVSGTTIEVTFNENLDETKFTSSDPNGFAVAGGGTETITDAQLKSGTKNIVVLTGTNYVATTTTVAYTAGTLTDTAGNALADIAAHATTN